MTLPYKTQEHKNQHKLFQTYKKEDLEKHNYDPESINIHKSTAESKGIVKEIKKMETLKQAAQNYVPQTTKNIADLEEVNIEDVKLEDREGKDKDGSPFKYKVFVLNEEEYRVPGSVIGQIKGILEKNSTLKRICVTKKGAGLNTEYQVIPVQ